MTKVGDEYYGFKEDIEMLKTSGFELKYTLQNKGTLKRYLVPKSNYSDYFSSEYECLRYFEAIPNNKDYTSVVVKNSENEVYLYTKGDPFDVKNICSKGSVTYNYS